MVRNWASGIGPLGVNLMARQGGQHDGFPVEIVGVVRDVKNAPLGQDVEPAIYFPTRQFPFSEVFLAVRATDLAAAQAAVRGALRQVVPAVPMGPARSWGDRVAATTAEARLLMSVLIGFGGLAGLLAALGVYGLFSWAVALRTRELAIRLTLGATPRSVGAAVVRQSAWLVGGGLVAGIGSCRWPTSPSRGCSTACGRATRRPSRWRPRCCWWRRSAPACRRRGGRCASIRRWGCASSSVPRGRHPRPRAALPHAHLASLSSRGQTHRFVTGSVTVTVCKRGQTPLQVVTVTDPVTNSREPGEAP